MNVFLRCGIFLSGMLLVLSIHGCSSKKPAAPIIAAVDSLKGTGADSGNATIPTDSLLSYEQRQGKVVYSRYCAVCHGAEGKGDGFNAYNLDPKPRDFSDAKYMADLPDDKIIQTITEGGRGVNRSATMPTWGGRLSKAQIQNLKDYIRYFAAGR